MKVIDLLNKIANGEEVPSKIKYRDKIFVYDKDDQCYIVENYNVCDDLLMSLSNHKGTDLNYEVEILEEKKIPKKLETFKDRNNEIFLDDLCYKYMPIHKDSLSFNEQVIVDKLNEVLDYLESKGE